MALYTPASILVLIILQPLGQDSWQNRYIFLYPRCMLDCGDSDWREVFFLEMSLLCVIPCESLILDTHKLMHELALFRPEEIFLVYLLDYFFCALWCIFPWVYILMGGTQLRHVFKRISLNLVYNPELTR